MAHGDLKKLVFPLLFMCTSFYAVAQLDTMGISKSCSKPLFQLVVNAGLLVGKSGRDFQVQAIPGIQYKSWFAGAGSGLDYYYWRTVPLFFDVRKTFSK